MPTPAQARVICDALNATRSRPGEWLHDTDIFPARDNRDSASRRVLNKLRDDGALAAFGLEVEQNCKPYVPRVRWADITTTLDELEAVKRERDAARTAIAWANNSLFGSHGFFLSINGGAENEHHLDSAIEVLKAGTRPLRAAEDS